MLFACPDAVLSDRQWLRWGLGTSSGEALHRTVAAPGNRLWVSCGTDEAGLSPRSRSPWPAACHLSCQPSKRMQEG